MSGFLHRLSPRHADALRPATPLRAIASAPAESGLPTREGPANTRVGLSGLPTDSPAYIADATASGYASSANASPRTAPTTPAHAMHEAPEPSAAPAPHPSAQPPQAALPQPPLSGLDAVTNRPASERSVIDARFDRAPCLRSAPAAFPDGREPTARTPQPLPIDVRPRAHAPPPLSASTVSRLDTAAATSAAPAIHLHIDRIDVRAAARPAGPAPARPRAAPEPQSLHDYLHGKRRG